VSAFIKILKYLLIVLMIATGTSCSPERKNPYLQKRKQNSKVSTSQLGRNRYYFSPEYQKKLNKNFKKK
jgi:hypothetical protein